MPRLDFQEVDMRWVGVKIILSLLVLLFSLSPLSALAAEPASVVDGIALDFRDVELVDLIQTVSEMTGKNFIYDDSIRGR